MTESSQQVPISKIWTFSIFHPIRMQVFAKWSLFWGYWWLIKIFSYFISKRNLIGSKIQKFCILKDKCTCTRYIEFLFFVQCWCMYFLWVDGTFVPRRSWIIILYIHVACFRDKIMNTMLLGLIPFYFWLLYMWCLFIVCSMEEEV
jgi:hypothetical protein